MRSQGVLIRALAEVRSAKVAVRAALASRVAEGLGNRQVLLHVVYGCV